MWIGRKSQVKDTDGQFIVQTTLPLPISQTIGAMHCHALRPRSGR
jgi:hypothetical protein